MSSLLLDGPISPELVLVAPPEEAEEARAALPDIVEFYDWIRNLRDLVDVDAEEVEDDRRGFVVFTSLVSLNAVVPLVLVVVWHVLS
jgi:hypothetical protein